MVKGLSQSCFETKHLLKVAGLTATYLMAMV